jgi:hypothetical protein
VDPCRKRVRARTSLQRSGPSGQVRCVGEKRGVSVGSRCRANGRSGIGDCSAWSSTVVTDTWDSFTRRTQGVGRSSGARGLAFTESPEVSLWLVPLPLELVFDPGPFLELRDLRWRGARRIFMICGNHPRAFGVAAYIPKAAMRSIGSNGQMLMAFGSEYELSSSLA